MDMKAFTVEEVRDGFQNLPSETRDCYSRVFEYVTSEGKENRICVLNGLPGSGNTTLMRQVANNLPPSLKEKARFITCGEGFEFNNLVYYLDASVRDGYKFFFIDEVTYAEEFQGIGMILPKVFVGELEARIVVSGTNSFVLCLAALYGGLENGELKTKMRDSMLFIDTTYIPFLEYARLTGCTDIREYSNSGGTFARTAFVNTGNAIEYVEQHVIGNMIRSFTLCGNLDSQHRPFILEYKDSKEFSQDIWNMIYTPVSHFLSEFMLKYGRATYLSIERNENDTRRPLSYCGIFYSDTKKEIKSLFHFFPKPTPGNSLFSNRKDDVLYDFLHDIGVLAKIPAYKEYASNTGDCKDCTDDTMTHPGLFLACARHFLDALLNDPNWLPSISREEKNKLVSHCLLWAERWIIEDVIIHEVSCMLHGNGPKDIDYSGRWYVAKLPNTSWFDKMPRDASEEELREHDVPVLIFDKQKKETYFFETVYSGEDAVGWLWSRKFEEFVGMIEQEFGKVIFRAELVTGRTDFSRDIPQIKIEDFLITMDKEIKKAGTAYELSDTIAALQKLS